MLPRNATHCLHTLHLDVFADIWFVNYIYSKFEIMAPNSQALKSVRIKNGKIVPFNSFCHPALIAWKWNKIIYGCERTHFVLIFKSSTRADLGDGRPASATCNTTTGARPITSTCIAQFDQPLEKFSYSALLSSLRSLSLRSLTLSLYGQCLACPFSVPEPKQRSWP